MDRSFGSPRPPPLEKVNIDDDRVQLTPRVFGVGDATSSTQLSSLRGILAQSGTDVLQVQGWNDEGSISRAPVSQTLSNVQVTGGNVYQVGRDLSVHVHHHHHAQGDGEMGELHAALKDVPNFRDIQITTLGKATDGTGDWIYVWEEFCIWMSADGSIRMMWGSGMPGAGKTILAYVAMYLTITAGRTYLSVASSLAINAAETRAQASGTPICVGFLYIRYSDHTRVTVRDLLEVLVKQTIERHPPSLQICYQIYASHMRERTKPSKKELLSLLKRLTSEMEIATFYFLDALDEAPAKVQRELLDALVTLNAKLFITSRPLHTLQARFPQAHHFPIIGRDSDLDIHISKEILDSDELQAIIANGSPGLEGRITLKVKQKCDGMFLHASLQLQALRQCTSRHDLDAILEGFPSRIADVYSETWNRITNQPDLRSSLAVRVLQWVAYASRSLTLDELRHAIATSPETQQFESGRLSPVETIISVCCGLLTIEEETGVVRLVHYTAQAVLRRLILEALPQPHSLLAMVCMGYLRNAGFQRSVLNTEEELEAALRASPLMRYAYHSWAQHARGALEDDTTRSRITEFVQAFNAFPIHFGKSNILGRFGPLHVAAYYDLPLSFAGPGQLRNVNLPAEQGLTPLHLACIGEAPNAVAELLTIPKIQVNAVDRDRKTPLYWAAEANSVEIVEILLSHPDIKVNQGDKTGFAPLHAAAWNDGAGAVEKLLAHPKIKVNATTDLRMTPLIFACRASDLEAIKLLVAHPQIDMNVADKEMGWTPLFWAAINSSGSDDALIRALLAHPKIDVRHRDKVGELVYHHAHLRRCKGVLEDLDPRRKNPSTSTSRANAGGGDAEQSSLLRLKDDFARLALSLGKR